MNRAGAEHDVIVLGRSGDLNPSYCQGCLTAGSVLEILKQLWFFFSQPVPGSDEGELSDRPPAFS